MALRKIQIVFCKYPNSYHHNITEKKDPLSDHEKYTNEENKYEKYFEENL